MWTRCVVNHKLNHWESLGPVLRTHLKHIMDQDAQHLLGYLMNAFHGALFHGPPWCSETMPKPKQSCKLLHQKILELWASV